MAVVARLVAVRLVEQLHVEAVVVAEAEDAAEEEGKCSIESLP
jgi:hypothetical protein